MRVHGPKLRAVLPEMQVGAGRPAGDRSALACAAVLPQRARARLPVRDHATAGVLDDVHELHLVLLGEERNRAQQTGYALGDWVQLPRACVPDVECVVGATAEELIVVD